MRHPLKSFAPILASFALTGVLAVTLPSMAQDQTPQPDNSAQNKNQNVTADQQSSATRDREMTAKIRRAVIAEKDLSTYAHNVKIIVHNGEVTLKGPVKSDDEKQKVQQIAAQVAGDDKVDNQISVKQQ